MPNQRSARDRAADHIQTVRDFWYPVCVPVGFELDAIPSDLLRELADERRMAVGERP
jgi:hypothetical protein